MNLKLTLKKKWFDLIYKREKNHEYREIKWFWVVRLYDIYPMPKTKEEKEKIVQAFLNMTWNIMTNYTITPKNIDSVTFYNGAFYGDSLPHFTREVIDIQPCFGDPRYGAPEKELVFSINLK